MPADLLRHDFAEALSCARGRFTRSRLQVNRRTRSHGLSSLLRGLMPSLIAVAEGDPLVTPGPRIRHESAGRIRTHVDVVRVNMCAASAFVVTAPRQNECMPMNVRPIYIQ